MKNKGLKTVLIILGILILIAGSAFAAIKLYLHFSQEKQNDNFINSTDYKKSVDVNEFFKNKSTLNLVDTSDFKEEQERLVELLTMSDKEFAKLYLDVVAIEEVGDLYTLYHGLNRIYVQAVSDGIIEEQPFEMYMAIYNNPDGDYKKIIEEEIKNIPEDVIDTLIEKYTSISKYFTSEKVDETGKTLTQGQKVLAQLDCLINVKNNVNVKENIINFGLYAINHGFAECMNLLTMEKQIIPEEYVSEEFLNYVQTAINKEYQAIDALSLLFEYCLGVEYKDCFETQWKEYEVNINTVVEDEKSTIMRKYGLSEDNANLKEYLENYKKPYEVYYLIQFGENTVSNNLVTTKENPKK